MAGEDDSASPGSAEAKEAAPEKPLLVHSTSVGSSGVGSALPTGTVPHPPPGKPPVPVRPEGGKAKAKEKDAPHKDGRRHHKKSKRSRGEDKNKDGRRGGNAAKTLMMFNAIKKVRKERAKHRSKEKKSGEEEYAVLQKSQDTLEHLESAMQSKNVLQPDTLWRQYWDFTILFFILYYWVMVPLLYVQTREENLLTAPGMIVVEVLGSVVFFADMVLCCATTSTDRDTGTVINELPKIRERYLNAGFAWDFLSALPLDLFILAAFGEGYYNGRILLLVSHLRLLKIFRLKSLFVVINSLRLNSQVVQFHYVFVPSIKMAFGCIVTLHIITVLFMLINLHDGFVHSDGDYETFTYTTSLYWTLYTVSSVGYGDIPVDTPWKRRFASVLFLVGVILHGVVISEITLRMQKGDVQSERRDKMKETLNIMRCFSIPEELRKEVFAFQYHQLHSSLGGQFMRVLETLPRTMQTRIDLYVRVKFICKVPMFASQSIQCLVALANGLANVVYEPEQVIIRAGDEGREMYFLSHGFLSVLLPSGEHVSVIRPGGFFGEVALLTRAKRNATIRTLTYCDLFRLMKDKFLEIMAKYPALENTVKEEVSRRQLQNAQAEKTKDGGEKDAPAPAKPDGAAPDGAPGEGGGMLLAPKLSSQLPGSAAVSPLVITPRDGGTGRRTSAFGQLTSAAPSDQELSRQFSRLGMSGYGELGASKTSARATDAATRHPSNLAALGNVSSTNTLTPVSPLTETASNQDGSVREESGDSDDGTSTISGASGLSSTSNQDASPPGPASYSMLGLMRQKGEVRSMSLTAGNLNAMTPAAAAPQYQAMPMQLGVGVSPAGGAIEIPSLSVTGPDGDGTPKAQTLKKRRGGGGGGETAPPRVCQNPLIELSTPPPEVLGRMDSKAASKLDAMESVLSSLVCSVARIEEALKVVRTEVETVRRTQDVIERERKQSVAQVLASYKFQPPEVGSPGSLPPLQRDTEGRAMTSPSRRPLRDQSRGTFGSPRDADVPRVPSEMIAALDSAAAARRSTLDTEGAEEAAEVALRMAGVARAKSEGEPTTPSATGVPELPAQPGEPE
eukprot:TRINITY_DN2711_c0_g1_i1.p1 TRINITY_DN2711_c0_g1~~TRINITY_DN2711_c0_g1_i1.p1  ORF type:complete len:1074 (+),score=364.89 TRINITY_DN2711_c0_g1_i1:129-3350(+)